MDRENNSSQSSEAGNPSRLSILPKYGLALLAIFLISFLFPGKARFAYEFEQGGIWKFDDLVAPHDFPIVKSLKEIEEEKAAIKADFLPFYELNLELARRDKYDFLERFKEQLQVAKRDGQFADVARNTEAYEKLGNRLIDNIYKEGVIAEKDLAGKEPGRVINLKYGNVTQVKTLQDLHTPADVELMISDSLFSSGLAEAEFLIPLLKDLFRPNVRYNDSLSQVFLNRQLEEIATSKGMVKSGDLIIGKGEVINETAYQQLVSYRQNYDSGLGVLNISRPILYSGYLILTMLLIGVLVFFLQFTFPEVFHHFQSFSFVLMWVLVYSYLVYLLEASQLVSVYAVPYCIAPIIIKVFFNERLALFTHIVIILMASILSSEGYEFTFLQMLAGIVVVLTNRGVGNWSRFFETILYIFLTYSLGYLGLSLIREGLITEIDFRPYRWIFINVFLTLLAFPLIPLLERIFGFTSPITLVELSDMNRPLLKELSIKAPGTLQHSLQVGNLAEAAAASIGADTLLVKVAALYHDIGKTKQPTYFIENQSGYNPHDDIDELESAKIIISHVWEGEKMARKAGLPKILIDFIRSHHGNTWVEYFYRNYRKKHPEAEIEESQFRYPGPRPKSKEETILMIADSLEAACKSLQNPTEKDLYERVDAIVAGKITSGQFLESAITFEELQICVQAFKKMLKSIYHVRIEYPKE